MHVMVKQEKLPALLRQLLGRIFNEQSDNQANLASRPSWCTQPEIPDSRKATLRNYLSITPYISPNHDPTEDRYPFKGVPLKRDDIEWLLLTHEGGAGPVIWNDEHQRKRNGLDLRGADLSSQNLSGLPLARIRGGLSGDEWEMATPAQHATAAMRLDRAILRGTHLEGADLCGVRLEGADLSEAHLEGANLSEAHLEWPESYSASVSLQPTDLRKATLDSTTNLRGILLGNKCHGFARLADTHWGGANLTAIECWKEVNMLGDERIARRLGQLDLYEAAIRANRQLSQTLREQGLDDYAAHFAHRALVLQGGSIIRRPLRSELDLKQLIVIFCVPILVSLIYEGVTLLPFVYQQVLFPILLLPLFMLLLFILPWRKYEERLVIRIPLLVFLLLMLLPSILLPFVLLPQSLLPLVPLKTLQMKLQLPNWLLLGHQVPDQMLLEFLIIATLLILLVSLLLRFHLPQMQGLQRLGRMLIALFSPFVGTLRSYARYTLSLFLDVLAGYGYKPWRSLGWYMFTIIAFAVAYYVVGESAGFPLTWYQALVVSVSSFHGRGFIDQPKPSNPDTVVAAIEAVIGLIIEISFITTFTQRFFGK
jgi:hypothetical protein